MAKLKSSLTGKTMIESRRNSAGRRAAHQICCQPRNSARSVTGSRKEVNRTRHKSSLLRFNLQPPSTEVWVRKEYLTDHQSGHGEFVKGVWVSAKSIPGRAFILRRILPEYAAMYDNYLSAFLSSPETPDRYGPS